MSKIELTIESFLKANLPDFDLPVSLEVASTQSYGQLASDVLIRYAQKTKRAPESIAKDLLPNLAVFQDDFQVGIESGYLNVSVANFRLGQLDFLQEIPRTQIIFPLSGAGRTDSYFLRILSLAGVQLILSNGRASLAVVSEQGIEDYSKYTAKLLELKALPSKSNFRDIVRDFIKKLDSQTKNLILWLSPEQLTKSEISKIYREFVASPVNLQIQIPHASWLKDLDQEIVTKYREQENPKERFKLNLLLSSATPSTDLFYEEAVLPQRNNLVWYLEMTASRLAALGIKAKSWDLEFQSSTLPETIDDLVWGMLLLPGNKRKAVVKGLVPDYLTEVYIFLERLNLFFNSPQLRQKILSKQCSELESQVLATGLFQVQELLQTLKGDDC